MQRLYDALITLGRSYEDARNGGWVCGRIGQPVGPKCINGLLTWHLGYAPMYIHQTTVQPHHQALRMAAVALIETRPEELEDEIVLMLGDRAYRSSKIRLMLDRPDTLTLQELEDVLVGINDLGFDEDTPENPPLIDEEIAAAWFERAFDRLATQLPDPIPASPPITVDDIVVIDERAPELV